MAKQLRYCVKVERLYVDVERKQAQAIASLPDSITQLLDVDVDVVDLRAQADASMPASNNNVKLYNISNF